MRTIVDAFFVSADASKRDELSIKGLDGKPLFVDGDFNKYHRAVQVATIESIPFGFSEHIRYEEEIKVGDKVYVHHFVVHPENKYLDNGKELYHCTYDQIFCIVRDGKIIPIEDWLFTVPVMESEDDIKSPGGIYFKVAPEPIHNHAIVKYNNAYSKSIGIREGDEVFYIDDAHYDIKIEGEDLYRMKNIMLLAKFENGDLIPFDDCFIIDAPRQDDEEVLPSGLVIVNLKQKKEQYGVVHKIGSKCNIDYKEGETFFYLNGQGHKLKHKDKYYIILKKKDVILDSKMYKELLNDK